jgi:hypothetical protein
MNNKNPPINSDLSELILLMIDGAISDEEFSYLEKQLSTNPDAVVYYHQFLAVYLGFNSYQASAIPKQQSSDSVKEYNTLLTYLAENEKTAQPLQIEKPEKEPYTQTAEQVQVERVPHKVNKMPLYVVIISLAAMLLLVTFVRFSPLPPSEVATLTESLNVKWVETGISTKSGARLLNRRGPMTLDSGFAEITFDNSAKIIVESPAKFEIITADQINLIYGRVYATVPREALGFTVCSANSKIIDLGTEFGVSAAFDGTTELHVIKGQTMLIAGDKSNRINIAVAKNSAKKITRLTSVVTDISCDGSVFVHQINSKKKFVWRGNHKPEIVDSLEDYNGRHSQSATKMTTAHQPAFLTEKGLEVTSIAENDSSGKADQAITFTDDGAIFGAQCSSDKGRNVIRTIDTLYHSITFDAGITIVNSDPNRQVWLGLGSGNLGAFGMPDCTFLVDNGSGYSPNAADTVWIQAQGSYGLSCQKQVGQTPIVGLQVNGPMAKMDDAKGLVRLQMHHDAAAKTILFFVDNDYNGKFAPDLTLGPISVSDLYRSSAARVYFGGDDSVILRDFTITVPQDNSLD